MRHTLILAAATIHGDVHRSDLECKKTTTNRSSSEEYPAEQGEDEGPTHRAVILTRCDLNAIAQSGSGELRGEGGDRLGGWCPERSDAGQNGRQ